MLIELQDMKDHGVLYPTFYQHKDTVIDAALTLRDSVGFPKDKIYTIGGGLTSIGNAIDPAGLATVANKVVQVRRYTEAHGYADTYFYGIDEAKGDILLSQRPVWQTVHDNGGKIFASGHGYELIKMVDILDTSVKAYELVPAEAAQWHSYGHEILSYQNPQVGIEDPEIYRNNYGVALWNAGYNGTMNFAYQFAYGDIWNDYDRQTEHYRDHVFAYPTSNGVIDTIQWEGWREGVDDTRYVAALIKKEGNDTSAKTIVSAGLSKNENMTTIRKKVIEQILPSILPSQVNRAPVLATIENRTVSIGSPLTFTVSATDPDGNPLTYSASSVPPTAIFNPATRTFAWTPTSAQLGTYRVTFQVSDGSLSDTESVWITAIVKADQTTPVCLSMEFWGTCIPEYTPVIVSIVIVALFGLAVYAMRFWRG
jgi:hypothetical protein